MQPGTGVASCGSVSATRGCRHSCISTYIVNEEPRGKETYMITCGQPRVFHQALLEERKRLAKDMGTSNLALVMASARRGGSTWHHFRTAFVRVCKTKREFEYHARSCEDLALLGERTLRILMTEEGMRICDWDAANVGRRGVWGSFHLCSWECRLELQTSGT